MFTTPEKHFFIIVNYNSGDNIIHCIHSILQSRNIHPLIIIVDNASRDNSLEECKIKFPNFVYIYNTHNIGFGAAANVGTRYALERGATTITFCNPDVVLDKNCAQNLIASIQSQKVHIVSPAIYRENTYKNIWFCGGMINYFTCRATHRKACAKTAAALDLSTDYITGCVMTVHASVFTKIGLFDEKFFLYYEDADLSVRARTAGFTLAIVPSALAYHHEVSENDKESKTYFLVLSGLLFFHKHSHGIMQLWFYCHFYLRRIKNYFERKKNMPLALSVYRAYCDYAKQGK